VPTAAQKKHLVGTGGPWGSGLLLLGVALTVQGVGYLTAGPDELRSALHWIDHGVPVRGWAMLWIAAGVYSMWKAITPPQRPIEIAPAVGVICLWAGIYAVYWLALGFTTGHWTRDWTTSVAWAGLACVLICFGRCVNPPHRYHRR